MADFQDFQDLNQKLRSMTPATAQSTLSGLLDVYNTIVSKLVTVADSYARSYVTVQRLGTDANGNVVDNTTANGEHIANQQIVRFQADVKSLKERKAQLETLLQETLQITLPSTTDMSVFTIKTPLDNPDQLSFNEMTDEDDNVITECTLTPDTNSWQSTLYNSANSNGVVEALEQELYTVRRVTSRGLSFVSLLVRLTGGGWNKVDANVAHRIILKTEDDKVYQYDFGNAKTWWPKTNCQQPVIKYNLVNGEYDLTSFSVGGSLVTLTEFTAAQYQSIVDDFTAILTHPGDTAFSSPVILAMVANGKTFSNLGNYVSEITCDNDDGGQVSEVHFAGYVSMRPQLFRTNPPIIKDVQQGDIVDVFRLLEPGLKPTGLEDAMESLLTIVAT